MTEDNSSQKGATNKGRKKILVISPYPEDVAPGQRLKYEQYFESWREAGYDLSISPFMTKRFWNIVYQPGRVLEKAFWTFWGYILRLRDLLRLPFYDGVYIFLWVTPFGFPVFERLFLMFNKNTIYDIDDMVFLGHVSDANKFILKLKGRSKMIQLMKKAKHVITCTPRLDEFVKNHNQETTDISSTIDTIAYIPRENYHLPDPVVLGWSGSHSTSKYLQLLQPVLEKIAKKRNIILKVIGDPNFKMKNVPVKAIAWERETEVKELSEISIGLYPLPNEDWVFGKSGLKALQYMALGIPTIASNIGANKRIIRSGENAFLVDSDEEWEQKILELIDNEELGEKLGKVARKTVVDQFSIIANEPKYLAILKKYI